MAQIRAVVVANDSIAFTDGGGLSRVVTAAQVPGTENTPARVEAWLNARLATLTDGSYQILVHVFSLGPLVAAVRSYPTGADVPPTWWAK